MSSKSDGESPESDLADGSPVVVGFLGRSGSGKTTILERLIAELQRRGLDVGAVKHTSHGFEADRPGKDSHRLYEAGSRAVALVSREQLAIFTRRSHDAPQGAPLSEALASLPPGLDVVLVEGFSWEPLPRFVIVPEGEAPIPEHLEKGEILGVVEVPQTPRGTKPKLAESLVESMLERVMERLSRR